MPSYNDGMEHAHHEMTGREVSWLSIAGNLILSLLKFAAGIFGHSMAMIADAVHSASDVLSTVIVLISLRLSSRQEDARYEYGYGRYESLAALILALMLGGTGVGIGYRGIANIFHGTYAEQPSPRLMAMGAAVLSIIIKEIMFQATRAVGRREKSDALLADAWHHRTDALSSIGSLIGIAFARNGFPVMDTVAAVLIALFVLYISIQILISAARKLTDAACDAQTERAMLTAVRGVEGVSEVESLKTRQFGPGCYVDVSITLDGNLSFADAHRISHSVEDMLKHDFEGVRDCMVHASPVGAHSGGE